MKEFFKSGALVLCASASISSGDAIAQEDHFAEAKALEMQINSAYPITHQGRTSSFSVSASRSQAQGCSLKMSYEASGGKGKPSKVWYDGPLDARNFLSLSQQDFLGDSVITQLYSETEDGKEMAHIYRTISSKDGKLYSAWIMPIPANVGLMPSKPVLEYRTLQKYFRSLSKACGFTFKVMAPPD